MNLSKYINIPYVHKGRDFSGCDCYGLVWLIYKNELGITLPDFVSIDYKDNWYTTGQNYIVETASSMGDKVWEVVKEPFKNNDILIFYLASRKIANHCGMYIGDNKFIHIYEDISACIDRLDHSPCRLYGTMRYKGKI